MTDVDTNYQLDPERCPSIQDGSNIPCYAIKYDCETMKQAIQRILQDSSESDDW